MNKYRRVLIESSRAERLEAAVPDKATTLDPGQPFVCREHLLSHSVLGENWAAPACSSTAFWTEEKVTNPTRH